MTTVGSEPHDPPPTGTSDPPAHEPAASQVVSRVVEVLGAASAFLIVLYLIGGLVMAARLHALDLPIRSTIALISTPALVVLALQLLWAGLLLTGVLWATLAWRAQRRSRKPLIGARRARWGARSDAVLAALILVAAVIVQIGITALSWPGRIALLGASLAAVGAAAWIFQADVTTRFRATALVALVVLLAGGLRIADEWVPPTRLDYASVLTKSGELVEGFYLAETNDALLIAPNVYDRTIGVVSAIPRAEVLNTTLAESEWEVGAIGQRFGTRLFGRTPPRLSPEEEHRRDAIVRYLANIRADIGWRYPPVVPGVAVEYLARNYDEFTTSLPHEWYEEGIPHVTLKDLLDDPLLYVQETIVTGGRVVRAHFFPDDVTGFQSQSLLFAGRGHESKAFCWVTRDIGEKPVSAGDWVRVRAAVAAAGTSSTRTGDAFPFLVLMCSAMNTELGTLRTRVAEVPVHGARRRARLDLSWRPRFGTRRVRSVAVSLNGRAAFAGQVVIWPGAKRIESSGGIRVVRHRTRFRGAEGALRARVVVQLPESALEQRFHVNVRVTDRRGRIDTEPRAATLTFRRT